jgi:PAS domain S-box-containing protein
MAERTTSVGTSPAARIRRVAYAIISASPDAALLIDQSGRIVEANRLACLLFGLGAKQIRGTRVRHLFKNTTRRRAASLSYPRAAGSPTPTYVTMDRCNRASLDMEVINKRNVAPGLHVRILRDLTPIKRAADALQRRSALLEQSETVGRIGAWAVNLETDSFERTPGMFVRVLHPAQQGGCQGRLRRRGRARSILRPRGRSCDAPRSSAMDA